MSEVQTTHQQCYAAIPLLRDLLPIFDDMRRAVHSANRASPSASLIGRIEMILADVDLTLRKHGFLQIAATGEEFDANLHEAAGQIPSDAAKGTVVRVLQPGCTIHGRVVRPACVIVSSGSRSMQ